MNELNRLNEERVAHREKYLREPIRLNVGLDTGAKIDIYEQVMNNWDIFLDIVWNSKQHRTRKPKETLNTNSSEKTGVWIHKHGIGWNTCSVCNCSVTDFDEEGHPQEFKFCPYCGGKMEKVIEEEIF
jgi:hypothetical protein